MRCTLITLAGIVMAGQAFGADSPPLLLQQPTLSRDRIAFAYGGDLWTVDRKGGDASRLTTGVGLEWGPTFSPDGRTIAFSGEYEGNIDVYVVPASGGEPRRVTHNPAYDIAVGWTPDGSRILFRSNRTSSSRFDKLFTVSLEGGLPEELPLPMGEQGSYSPDGTRLAYVPFWNRRGVPTAFISWNHYRGGKASPIWLADLSDSRVTKVPRPGSNDSDPMWVGDLVYFLSDRGGSITLYAHDTKSGIVKRVVDDGPDIRSASSGPGGIVLERGGGIELYEFDTGSVRTIPTRIAGDLPGVRPRFEKVAKRIQSADLSPTGTRVVFESRGEILTVPAEKGDTRNLTKSPGVADRYPSWSPDGRWIAAFSDESGEYALHLIPQDGKGDLRKIDLGDPPSFYYSPAWSPDSKKIAFTDKRLQLWVLDLEKGKAVVIDRDTYDSPMRTLDPSWSPDGRWIAYSKRLKNHLRAVYAYSIENGRASQLTDGLSDARFPVFDAHGKYLYFAASTDAGPTSGWLDMSSMNRPVTRSVYVAVLRNDIPSPLAPQSDEEKPKPVESDKEKEKGKEKTKDSAGPEVRIDPDGLDQRILALPLPPRNYAGLAAGGEGTLYVAEAPAVMPRGGPSPGQVIHKFDLKTRKSDRWLDGAETFALSHDHSKVLYKKGDGWFLTATSAPPKPGDGALKLDAMEVRVDPRAEWAQMYREVWRIQRDFLYDPKAHGFDLMAAEARYKPFLSGIAHRNDLNVLFSEMLGEISIGHLYVSGGDTPELPKVRGGLLGADYSVEGGRYRFSRVFPGVNWNPELKAPLTQPGVNVKAGEFLLAVDGKELKAPETPDAFLEATAGKSVVLRVGPNADGTDSREVTVVPIESEAALRNLAWIEANRKRVEQLSDGKLAYVYLPDTGAGGYTNFNRYYFAQIDKQGAVIDERFNGGGTAADYIIDAMRRPLMNYWTTREGADFTTPVGSIFGPKAMIVNEAAGSGGDALPWYFRKAGLGPLVGTRTWGGLVGIYDYPTLIDGGTVTAPRVAFRTAEGAWDVENKGVAPDIEVDLDPRAVRQGHDPQLEKAVEVVLEAIRKQPAPPVGELPPYPDYSKARTPSAAGR
ncbi:MAG: PDZ domain-containing protein [Isosphaeraceae bacterium]